MPYVQGESLRSRLERETQLPVADAVRIAAEIAAALDYAHRHGRDPPRHQAGQRPVSRRPGAGGRLRHRAGLERRGRRDPADEVGRESRHAAVHESRAGVRGAQARTRGADVYALGAVLYEMLAGQPPFTGPTVAGDPHAGHVGGAPARSAPSARRSRPTSTPRSCARWRSSRRPLADGGASSPRR